MTFIFLHVQSECLVMRRIYTVGFLAQIDDFECVGCLFNVTVKTQDMMIQLANSILNYHFKPVTHLLIYDQESTIC